MTSMSFLSVPVNVMSHTKIYHCGGIDRAAFLIYNYFMIVSVEIVNQGTLNLLRELENLGLIHVHSSTSYSERHLKSASSSAETVLEKPPSYLKLRGIHKNISGGSVDDFLAHSRKDKENELAIEKRQEEERARLAKAKLSP